MALCWKWILHNPKKIKKNQVTSTPTTPKTATPSSSTITPTPTTPTTHTQQPQHNPSNANPVPKLQWQEKEHMDEHHRRESKETPRHRGSYFFPSLEVSEELLHSVQITASIRIQAQVRGWLVRRRIRNAKHNKKNFAHGKSVTKSNAAQNMMRNEILFETKYSAMGILGTGNYAVVRRGVEKETHKEYAIKEISKANLWSELDVQLLVDEIAIMRQIDHPTCVHLYDYYETITQHILVLELLKGKDLFEQIKFTGHLSEATVVDIVLQLASALEYLHDRSIVHRDIKAENILYADQRVLLIDFGLAKVLKEPEHLMCGTLSYMAPEIVKQREVDAPGYTHVVDIWALGVVVYLALSGTLPFVSQAHIEEELFSRIIAAKVTFTHNRFAGVSERAKHFIKMALQPEPSHRITAKQMLEHSWLKEFVIPRTSSGQMKSHSH